MKFREVHVLLASIQMNYIIGLIKIKCYKEYFIFRWKFDCGRNKVYSGGFKYICLQGDYSYISNISKLNNHSFYFILNFKKIVNYILNKSDFAIKLII